MGLFKTLTYYVLYNTNSVVYLYSDNNKQIEIMTTITATPNHSARTFTLRTFVNGKLSNKYRTAKLPKEVFENESYNTDNDWKDFLRSGEYFKIK